MASMAIAVGMRACYFTTSSRSRWFRALAGGFLLLDNFAPLIIPALGAGTMRQLAFVTVGAIRQRLRSQMIMGAALRRSGLRMPPFRIRHEKPLITIARKYGDRNSSSAACFLTRPA